MNRRDVFKLTALAAGAPAATSLAQDQGKPTIAAAWKPEAMDAHQNETLAVFADLIIPDTDTPGAKAANVHRYIDALLKEGPDSQREEFMMGLAWVDNYAIRKHAKTFLACNKAEQTSVLTALEDGTGDEAQAGHKFFRQAKSLIANVYYNTAIGFRELNKGGRVPKTFACKA